MELDEFDIEFLAQKMAENPRSPLFARLADLYLNKEQSAEAMNLLEEGIRNFPNYYAGHMVLGKAHLSFKEYSKASEALKKAKELSPFNLTIAKLLESIPKKPDESIRTTDETYFAPAQNMEESAEAVSETVTEEPEVSFEPEPAEFAEPELSQPEVFEIAETPIEQETFTPEPLVETEEPSVPLSAEEDVYSLPVQSDGFPTFDEYLAENQKRIETDHPIRLDNYLNNTIGESFSEPSTSLSGPAPDDYFSHLVEDAALPADDPVIPDVTQEPEAEPEKPLPPKKKNIFELAEESESEDTPVGENLPQFDEPSAEEPAAELPVSPELPEEPMEFNNVDEPAEESPAETTDLDSLTEKLQRAEKIVPEENYKSPSPVKDEGQEEPAYETDAVSPTLAEIYASQGEYRAAIQAYEILMFSQPEKGADYQKRIRELQQKQMEKDGLI